MSESTRNRSRRHAVFAAVTLCLIGRASLAAACDPATNPPPPASPRYLGEDRVPGPMTISQLTIRRGRGPGGGCASSCDDLGMIHVSFRLPQTSPCDFAYRVKLVGGMLPAGLTLPNATFGARCPDPAAGSASLSFHWMDEARDDQDPFSFKLELSPLDSRGLGHATTVDVAHDGSPGGGGCGFPEPSSTADAGTGEAGLPPGDAAGGRVPSEDAPRGEASVADAALTDAGASTGLSSRSCGCAIHPSRAPALAWLAIGVLLAHRRLRRR